MDWRSVVLFFCFFSLTAVTATGTRCEVDSDCPPEHNCRLLCRRTCRSVCVRLKSSSNDEGQRIIASYEDSTPFSTPKSDIFVEEAIDSATPLTISEMQLDEELYNIVGTGDSFSPQRDDIVIQSTDNVPPISERGPKNTFLSPDSIRSRGSPTPSRTHHLRPHQKVEFQPFSGGFNGGNSVAGPNEVVGRVPPPPSGSNIPLPNGPPAPPRKETIRVAVPSISALVHRTSQSNSLPNSRKSRPPSLPAHWRPPSIHSVASTLLPPTQALEVQKTNCPPPPICDRNCGIYLDSLGCQTCRCLWLSTLCRHDKDCYSEGQFCDFGRCECRTGYVHSRTQSGVCEPVLSGKRQRRLKNNFSVLVPLRSSRRPTAKGIKIASNTMTGTIVEMFKARPRRSEVLEKPHREERLQWPGTRVCNLDSECAPGLYCINFDCWALPNKPLKLFRAEEIISSTSSPATRRFHKAAGVKNLDVGDQLFPDFDQQIVAPPASPPAPPPTTTPVVSITDLTDDPLPPMNIDDLLSTTETTTKLQEEETTGRAAKRKKKNESHPSTTTPSFFYDTDDLTTTLNSNAITDEQLNQEVTSGPLTFPPEFTSNKLLSTKSSSTTTTTEQSPTTEGWQEMLSDSTTEFSLPLTESPLLRDEMAHVFLDYSLKNRQQKPVRVESKNVRGIIDECNNREDCGPKYVCCAKRYCDLEHRCANGKFCLPDCRLTKMIHAPGTRRSEEIKTLIDLIYD